MPIAVRVIDQASDIVNTPAGGIASTTVQGALNELDSEKAATSHTTPTMVASGASHAGGHVPDPPSVSGTTKYLREDGTWAVPPGAATLISAVLVGTDVSAPAASVTINVPGGYKAYLVKLVGRGDAALTNASIQLRLNADTGANYNVQRAGAANTTVNGTRQTAQTSMFVGYVPAASASASRFSGCEITVLYPDRTDHHRVVQSLGMLPDSPGTEAHYWAGNWMNAANAVSSITLFPSSGNFVSGTYIAVWGLN